MPRTHPPTLITLVRGAIRDLSLIPRGSTVLVAVSGGPDSMALLHVLARLRERVGFGLFAHGVDHGLRAAAPAELDAAATFAASLEVPFTRTVLRVEPGGNLQARAREARWEALRAAADRSGAERIATGHHADDRAETLLMRVLRGSHPAGLAVLPARRGDRIRPMIRARRADVLAHVQRHHIPFSDDPSNLDPRFLRARVRHELMPLLERLGPRVVDHICTLAEELGDATLARGHGAPSKAATPAKRVVKFAPLELDATTPRCYASQEESDDVGQICHDHSRRGPTSRMRST